MSVPLVSKCYCFCSLKYGLLTYGIICLVARICGLVVMYSYTSGFINLINSPAGGKDSVIYMLVIPVTGAYVGWLLATSIILCVALKGIIQGRSILLYPYIVVLLFEIVTVTIATVVQALAFSSWAIISLLIVGIADAYAAICFIGLYQEMKYTERKNTVMFGTNPYEPAQMQTSNLNVA